MVDDTISRQSAIDVLIRESTCDGAYGYIDTKSAVETMMQLPSAQPEIIRCSECTQYRRWIDTDISFCDLIELERTPDDFCSRADRRTDE